MYKSPKDMDAKDHQAIEDHIPSRADEKQWGVWSFKGEKDNSQEDKNKCLVNEYLPCHADKSSR